ncbi:MAG TPA: response regulator [Pyrinomonadaceae bacterium]|jgi:DNA-binding response OmpR family regulator|nr:response regulator [Pyrinomonadaceae bacterium]
MTRKKRVLCVDDNTDTCALVDETLKQWEVAAEHTSTEGLRHAAGEKFDLILLDYHLPDGTGLDLCRQIRLFDVTTPILLVTVTHSIEHNEVLAAGGQGVIRKDHLIHVLPVAIANALEPKLSSSVP